MVVVTENSFNVDNMVTHCTVMIRIGYMGIPFSNSEEAAAGFARRNGWTGFELVPLVDSAGVVDSLLSGTTDYGVVAVSNSSAGKVEETERALDGKTAIETVQTLDMSIHHCIFAKNLDSVIGSVASHIQALLQTRGTLDRLYPGTSRLEVEDTALAAKYLAEGTLSDDHAVICRKDAGERYGLTLIRENAEDCADNRTTFALLIPRDR